MDFDSIVYNTLVEYQHKNIDANDAFKKIYSAFVDMNQAFTNMSAKIQQNAELAEQIVERVPAVDESKEEDISKSFDRLPDDMEDKLIKLINDDIVNKNLNKKGQLPADSNAIKYLESIIDEYAGDFSNDIKQGALDSINVALGEAIGTMGSKIQGLDKSKFTKNAFKILGAAVTLLAILNPDAAMAAEPLQNFLELGSELSGIIETIAEGGNVSDVVDSVTTAAESAAEAANQATQSISNFEFDFSKFDSIHDVLDAAPDGKTLDAISEYFYSGLNFNPGGGLASDALKTEFREMFNGVSRETRTDVLNNMFDMFLENTNASRVSKDTALQSFRGYISQLLGQRI